MAKDYNAINFKNKDIDKFAGKFGNGDPLKKANISTASESTSVKKPAIITKDSNLESNAGKPISKYTTKTEEQWVDAAMKDQYVRGVWNAEDGKPTAQSTRKELFDDKGYKKGKSINSKTPKK